MIAPLSSLQRIADAFNATLSINLEENDAEMAFNEQKEADTAYFLVKMLVGWNHEQIKKTGSCWAFRIRTTESKEA